MGFVILKPLQESCQDELCARTMDYNLHKINSKHFSDVTNHIESAFVESRIMIGAEKYYVSSDRPIEVSRAFKVDSVVVVAPAPVPL
jgi:hypothetical protein